MAGEKGGVDLAAKVARLSQAETYPENPRRVVSLETHLSWVFLTGQHAYKLKKPVRARSLDLRSLEVRYRNCLEEVSLNRRLAPNVYEGLSALTSDGEGHLALNGGGKPVEWLVRMRRLPEARMLDRRIAEGNLSLRSIASVACLLTRFYQAAPAVMISGEAYRRRFVEQIQEQRRTLARPEWGLPRGLIESIFDAQRSFLHRHRALLEARAVQGRLVEGHGDLRPEHICLETPPVIFDCLEFSRQLRLVDPVDELAFLALDCRRLGAPEVQGPLFANYRAWTGDDPPVSLIAFYRSCRACLWAKLATWRLEQEADPGKREKWRARALEYLRLGEGREL